MEESMKKPKNKGLILVCSTSLLVGCATMEQSAGLATLGCAGVGVLTGILTKNAGAGAGAGAGCLALAGIAIYNYHSSQSRTAVEDQKLYGYTSPVNSTEVKIRNATAFPEMIKPGDKLKVNLDYSVMAPQGTNDVNVQETMVLKRDGKVLNELSNRSISRKLGGGNTEAEFQIPAKLPPGTYVIEHKVQAGTSYDVRPTVFVVAT
jgi:hypothetical protein